MRFPDITEIMRKQGRDQQRHEWESTNPPATAVKRLTNDTRPRMRLGWGVIEFDFDGDSGGLNIGPNDWGVDGGPGITDAVYGSAYTDQAQLTILTLIVDSFTPLVYLDPEDDPVGASPIGIVRWQGTNAAHETGDISATRPRNNLVIQGGGPWQSQIVFGNETTYVAAQLYSNGQGSRNIDTCSGRVIADVIYNHLPDL